MPRIVPYGPKAAIKKECAWCKNGNVFNCCDDMCYLNEGYHTFKSALRRIKRHCISCVPSQSIQGVGSCDGKVLNPEPHDCPLHPFRLGTNPNRRGMGDAKNLHKSPPIELKSISKGETGR
jgi:hypothetical protein